ncbi:MAG: DinB family protein [Chitinophagaceae bacterium]
MEPEGIRPLAEIRQELKDQAARCLQYLHSMPNGEGIVYKTTMTVNNLGKIDVYQYIYFLAQHAARHITQMQKVQDEFTGK